MKNYLILSILVIFLLGSCKDYLDVNVDPNNPTAISPDLMLPVAQVYTANYLQEDRGLSHLGNMFMYNWSEAAGYSWYQQEFLYDVNSVFYPRMFDNAYSWCLKQYNDLEGLDSKYDNYRAIGKIMKSYHFQILVDLYGDIPYFDALQRGENSTPAYDGAALIYADLLIQLDTAINIIHNNENNPVIEDVKNDVIFDGNMTNWLQFANTLKLRILNRMGATQAQITAINNEGSGYITADVVVQPAYANEVDKQSPFWNSFGESVTGSATMTGLATCATQWILDYLDATGDDRLNYLYEEPGTGHLGVNQGLSNIGDGFVPALVSNIGPGLLKSATQGVVIFSLAESNFNQAEIALNGLGGDPEIFYNAGVQASFNYLGAGSAAGYLSQGIKNVNYAFSAITPAAALEAIITQKWLAVNGITAEQSWFDYSRTGYPAGLPVSNMASTPDRPVRLAYPTSEVTGNSANIPSQPNVFTSKIFWAN